MIGAAFSSMLAKAAPIMLSKAAPIMLSKAAPIMIGAAFVSMIGMKNRCILAGDLYIRSFHSLILQRVHDPACHVLIHQKVLPKRLLCFVNIRSLAGGLVLLQIVYICACACVCE
jgi:hypothetical protein